MNRRFPTTVALQVALLSPGLLAQQEATTLHALAQRAAVVAVATVLASSDPSPDFHRLEFATASALKGAPGQRFSVLEPAGRCCGRALATLAAGDRCLLFLARRGAALHPLAGERGIAAADAATVQHVRALLASTDAASDLEVLAAALQREPGRVADDAALALAALPATAVSGAARTAMRSALAARLLQPDAVAPALVTLGVRHAGAAAIAELLPAYLAAAGQDQQQLLRDGLLLLPAPAVREALAAVDATAADTQVRLAELLRDMPDVANLGLLRGLLPRAQSPRAALAVAEAMLAAGVAAADLADQLPAPVLELALHRRAALPRLRTIAPGSRR